VIVGSLLVMVTALSFSILGSNKHDVKTLVAAILYISGGIHHSTTADSLLDSANSGSCVVRYRRWPATGRCNVPTDSCKFPTEEIMGAQSFNFAPEFPQNGDFQPQILYFCKVI